MKSPTDYYETVVHRARELDIPCDDKPTHVSNTSASAVVLKSFETGYPLVEFIFADSPSELHKVLKRMVQSHTVVCYAYKTEELYVVLFQEGKRYEFDVAQGREARAKLEGMINSVLDIISDADPPIERFDDERLRKIFEEAIDRENRVKEGGLLIASYIKYYLEAHERYLYEKIPAGWGKIVLQLMVLYYLHRRGLDEGIDRLRFDTVDTYFKVRSGELDLDPDGYTFWELLRDDLEKLSKISKDVLFSVREWDDLNSAEIKIPNRIFVGDLSAAEKLRYENLRKVVNKLRRELSRKADGVPQSASEFVEAIKSIGIFPLFELRRWYESGLIGDIIGGVYEGIKKIEERKKGGIYYTPHFVVKYIVDNTIEPYLKEIASRVSGTEVKDLHTFIQEADISVLEKFYTQLSNIKILDPACGTGHFLTYTMGKLREYYHGIWLRARSDGGNFPVTILDEKGIREVHLKDIDENAIPFVIRQHLILRNNIYGVDIDREAHLIAKARMLIEVFAHYTKDVAAAGYAFPNLEMNIKEGNSLIGFASWDEVKEVARPAQITDWFGNGKPGRLEKIRRLIKEAKEKTFSDDYENAMQEARKEMNELYLDYLDRKGVKISLDELLKLKPFHWILEFPSVFEGDNPGFDIVVGNPPYGKTEKLFSREEKLIVTATYAGLFDGPSEGLTTDISVLFLYRGTKLAKNNGTLSYILTNKWMRSDYGRRIREFLKHYYIAEIVDFGHKMVFPDATAYTMIITVKNAPRPANGKFAFISPNHTDPEAGVVLKQDALPAMLPLDMLTEEKWTLDDPLVLEILDYVRKTCVPLRSLSPKIYRGVTTGYNEAFIIDTETRNRLIKEDPKSAELIKPLLRGRDIDAYKIKWDGKWIIATFPSLHINIEKFPSILSYLSKYRNKLEPKPKGFQGQWSGRKAGPYEWFEIQDTVDYYPEFEKPKIVWQEISKEPAFAYDVAGFYSLAKTFISTGLRSAYVVVFNSKIVHFLFKRYTVVLSHGYLEWQKTYVEKLYVPKLGDDVARYVEHVLDYLTVLSQLDLRHDALAHLQFVSNALVYELYFKDKFHEDGLYPEPKYYLLEAVSRHLKPINYDEWAKLYWRKKSKG